MIKTCKQCGKEFTLSEGDIKYYEYKKYKLPERCKQCREKNREEKKQTVKNVNKLKNFNSKPIKVLIAIVILLVSFCSYNFFSPYEQNSSIPNNVDYSTESNTNYTFSSDKLLDSHFDKHGSEFSYSSKKQYVDGANKVISNPKSLHKIEDDGDDIYYLEETNELVVVSTDGYIRTYFKPEDGIDYFLRT